MEVRYVIELYKNLAPVYEELYGEEQRLKYWRIASQTGERVVDVGCGTGIAFEVLDGYVVCLDISIDMLKRAREKKGDLGELIVADLWRPPLRDNSFDSALFLSSVDKSFYGQVINIWRGVAYKLIFEFRGEWHLVEQRN